MNSLQISDSFFHVKSGECNVPGIQFRTPLSRVAVVEDWWEGCAEGICHQPTAVQG